jgi:plasmid stability protein
MPSLMVRNIPEDAKLRFRQVAAAHGRSMEEHLRQLVISAGLEDTPPLPLAGVSDVSHSFRHFESAVPLKVAPEENWVDELIRLANGADLKIPPRSRTPHIPPEL